MSEQEPLTFEIGLVMAGAVSAGAYTGGVVDFLMESLATWDRQKRAGDPGAPGHGVCIKVITGASAGAITAAVLGSSLRDRDYPFAKPTPLYRTWVSEVDIDRLLGNGDLENQAPVRSLLNSDALQDIAGKVLAQSWNRSDWPVYLADPLQFYFTVTNLRGVPYAIQFGSTGGDGEYGMTLHADHMHFSLSPAEAGGNCPPTALELGTAGNRDGLQQNWAVFKNSALASGAFPVGLAAQPLFRTGTWAYDLRPWAVPKEPPADPDGSCRCTEFEQIEPAWPKTWPAGTDRDGFRYDFVNVDGGVANNEPFEIARRCLAGEDGRNPRDAKEACRAVLMVDPFPDDAAFQLDYDPMAQTSLLRVIPTLLSAMVSQLRFKAEELVLARDPKVFSRWIISPRRWETVDGSQRLAPYAIACGGLGGFGGFFAQAFRDHDYRLGRRNAQKFLRDTLVLHADNPLFAGWTAEQRQAFGLDRDDGRYLPVIPLLGDCAEVVPQPAWPAGAMTEQRYRDFTARLNARADKLIDGLNSPAVITSYWERLLITAGWNALKLRRFLVGKSLADPIVAKIREDMTRRGL
jgi:hypothetical protein